MNFEQFKNEWKQVMVYKPKKFDFEEEMHDLYIDFKEATSCNAVIKTVKEFCEFFFLGYDLDTHDYMLKDLALNTHHGNILKKSANEYRKSVGLPELHMIEKCDHEFGEKYKASPVSWNRDCKKCDLKMFGFYSKK